MTNLTMSSGGQITLPPELRDHYGLTPEKPLRVIQTKSGILLIPLTDAPMEPALQQELQEWQALGAASWDLFPYEEPES